MSGRSSRADFGDVCRLAHCVEGMSDHCQGLLDFRHSGHACGHHQRPSLASKLPQQRTVGQLAGRHLVEGHVEFLQEG